MAIAIVGTPTTASQASGIAAITINYPAGIAAGHVAYCYINEGATQPVPGKTWALLGTSASVSGFHSYLFRRVLDGTEGASETFTASAASCHNAEMRVYSGVNNTTPEDTSASNPQFNVSTTTTASMTCSGFTTNQNGDELVFFGAVPTASPTMSTPAGWGNAIVNQDATHSQTVGGWDKAQASAGVTGSVTSTLSPSATYFAVLVALQPAAAAVVLAPHRRPRIQAPLLRYRQPKRRRRLLAYPIGTPFFRIPTMRPRRWVPIRVTQPKRNRIRRIAYPIGMPFVRLARKAKALRPPFRIRQPVRNRLRRILSYPIGAPFWRVPIKRPRVRIPVRAVPRRLRPSRFIHAMIFAYVRGRFRHPMRVQAVIRARRVFPHIRLQPVIVILATVRRAAVHPKHAVVRARGVAKRAAHWLRTLPVVAPAIDAIVVWRHRAGMQ